MLTVAMYRQHFAAVVLFLAKGKAKKDESSSEFSMVQYMVIPFAILQSRESEGSDLFISRASSAREH